MKSCVMKCSVVSGDDTFPLSVDSCHCPNMQSYILHRHLFCLAEICAQCHMAVFSLIGMGPDLNTSWPDKIYKMDPPNHFNLIWMMMVMQNWSRWCCWWWWWWWWCQILTHIQLNFFSHLLIRGPWFVLTPRATVQSLPGSLPNSSRGWVTLEGIRNGPKKHGW